MSDYAYVLRAPYAVSDPNLTQIFRDQLLAGANSGVRFLYDLAFPWCYPAGAFSSRPAAGSPADGATVRDIAERADGFVREASGEVISYAGGGFELKAVTKRGCYIEIPAAVNADIFAAAPAGAVSVGASQLWLECHYMIWPNATGWTGHSASVFAPLFCSAGTDANPSGSYLGGPERVWFGFKTDGTLQVAVQQSAGSVAGTNFITLDMGSSTANIHRGRLTQVAAWRTSGNGIAIRLRSSAGTSLITGTATANTSDYSANRGKVGVTTNAQWETSGMNLSSANWRLFRGFVENLARSGRTPATVLDDDWTRVQARIAASAAANGGTSLIFV